MTTRRELIGLVGTIPILPFLTLKGTKSPCRTKVAGTHVRVRMEDGTHKVFVFPETAGFVCEVPKEEE